MAVNAGLPASTLACRPCEWLPRSEGDAQFGRRSSVYTPVSMRNRYDRDVKGTHIRVRVIDESVEQLNRLPHAHAGTRLLLEVFPRLDVESNSLLLWIDGKRGELRQ